MVKWNYYCRLCESIASADFWSIALSGYNLKKVSKGSGEIKTYLDGN